MAWCLSLFIELLCLALLGSWSHRCHLSWGRRKPFITLLSSMGVILGLLLVSNSGQMARICHGLLFEEASVPGGEQDKESVKRIYEAIDWSSMDLGKYLRFTGILSTEIFMRIFPFCFDSGNLMETHVSFIFDAVAVVYAVCLLTTVCTFQEIPLNVIEKDEKLKPITARDIQIEMAKHKPKVYYVQVVCI